MADSTTKHETEPVALDKVDLDKADLGASPADTEVADAEVGEKDDTAGGTKRKRGRRARRAAASTAGTAAAAEAASAKAGRRPKAEKRSKAGRRGKADAGSKAEASKAEASEGRGKRLSRLLDARPLRRIIAGLTVVAVVLLALVIVDVIKGPGPTKKLEAQEDRREDARQSAASELPRLYSFDYRQIDANITEQLNLTVGAIHDQIQSSTAPALQALAPKTKVVVQAVAVDSAVLSDDAQSVQVIVFLNQATTNNLLPAPRLDRNRLIATMQSVNGQWKIADVRAV